ncbi:hypothetical protein LTR60_004604 [Cryomyces antarcticus]|nr:hypothetical protein LTR60_004604 [Cryomyces antarcticus]
MSLMRAFTTRRQRPTISPPSLIGRAASQRNALLSTTNMLSYNAPDIAGAVLPSSASSSSESFHSCAEDSDASTANSIHSNDTITDASSVDSSPTSPEPNHLSCYFKPSIQTGLSRSSSTLSTRSKSQSIDAPILPQRALTHTKKNHERLARKRSQQHMAPPSSLTTREGGRASADLFRSDIDQSHPFGKELEQLNEVAEEFGGVCRDVAEEDEDIMIMAAHGLMKYGATDYMSEIEDLFTATFVDDDSASGNAGWI